MNLKRLNAILCMILIVSIPVAVAVEEQFVTQGRQDPRGFIENIFSTGREEDLGDAIIVNIKDYEPKMVRESLLEQQDVPVFIQLKGTTISSIFGTDPLTGITMFPPIKNIQVRMNGTSEFVSGSPTYVRPRREEYSLDNMGYLVVNLRKITDKERLRRQEIPEGSVSGVIETKQPGIVAGVSEKVAETLGKVEESDRAVVTLDMNAKVFFDLEEGRMFGINNQDLILREERDANAFFARQNKMENSFFSGRGFIRAVQIDKDSATFTVYNRNYRPVNAFFESGAILPAVTGTGMLERNTGIRLTKGQPSRVLNLGDTGDYFRDAFRVKLNEVITPQDKAVVNLIVNNNKFNKILVEGSKLYEGSGWSVSEIEKPVEKEIDAFKAGEKYGIDPNRLTGLSLKEEILTITLRNGIGDKKVVTSTKLIGEGINIDSIVNLGLTQEDADVIIAKYCGAPIAGGHTNYACVAIDRYKEVLNKATGEQTVEAYKGIYSVLKDYLIIFEGCRRGAAGAVFDPLACRQYTQEMNDLTYYYYKLYEAAGGEPDSSVVEQIINRISTDSAYLTDESVVVELRDVKIVEREDKGSVKFKIEGAYVKNPSPILDDSLFYLNDIVPLCDDELISDVDVCVNQNNNEKYVWKIFEIQPSSIVLKKYDIDKDLENNKGIIPGKYFEDKLHRSRYSGTTLRLLPGNSEVIVVRGGKRSLFGSSQENEPDVRKQVEVTDLITNNEASVTILPGSDKAFVDTSFKVHIPIDLRLKLLTPQQMEEHVKKTREIIGKLDGMIEKLDNIIKYWKRTCILTFGVLVLKNSLGGGTKAIARKTVMPHYKKVCNKEVNDRTYGSMEECFFAKDKEIMQDIRINQEAIDETNREMEKYKSVKEWREKSEYDEVGVPFEQYREDTRLKILEKKYKDAGFTDESPFLHDMKDQYKNEWGMPSLELKEGDITKSKEILNADAIKFGCKSPGCSSEDEQNIRKAALKNLVNSKGCDSKKTIADRPYCEDVGQLFPKQDGTYVATVRVKDTPTGEFKVENTVVRPLTELDYQLSKSPASDLDSVKQETKNRLTKERLDKGRILPVQDSEVEYEIAKMAGQPHFSEGLGQQVYFSEDKAEKKGPGYKLKPDAFLFGSTISPGIAGPTRPDYEEGVSYSDGNSQKGIVAQYDSDGKARCWPTGEGNYIEVVGDRYAATGKVKEFRVMNVGANGVIDCAGAGDDVPTRGGDESFVKLNPNYQNWKAQIDNSPVCKKDGAAIDKVGSFLGIGGKKVICSMNQNKIVNNLLNPSCVDVMDPTDCKILFNACDPVMCPASRCNLGGRYQVDNVMQTGIIGSTVLCLPNYKQGVVVPVCLTGISAGLKNIRSILQGYVDCLETSLAGKAEIGICDYIRSVGMCEFIWKEAVGIFSIRGGLMDWLSEKVGGEEVGGTEYLTFQSSLNNVGESMNYFTNEYKNTFMASFVSQSTDEVGGQLCRMWVNGKLPNIGEAIDQLSEPENPPQFTAFMDEAPYVEGIGEIPISEARGFGVEELVMYKVFYHVYAGTGFPQTTSFLGRPEEIGGIHQGPVKVAVFMRNDELGLPPLYMTTNPRSDGRRYVDVAKGGYVQTTVQTVARKGYNELCIHIQGRDPECGFRKVSTAFSFNKLSDNAIKNEASKKEIKDAKSCVSETGTTEFALGAVTLPEKMGMFTSGVVRVCSVGIPTDEPSRWSEVGACGDDDKTGRPRGSCWLDKRSLRIKDAGVREDIEKGLLERVKDKVLDTKDAVAILKMLNEERKKLLDQINELVEKAKKDKAKEKGVEIVTLDFSAEGEACKNNNECALGLECVDEICQNTLKGV